MQTPWAKGRCLLPSIIKIISPFRTKAGLFAAHYKISKFPKLEVPQVWWNPPHTAPFWALPHHLHGTVGKRKSCNYVSDVDHVQPVITPSVYTRCSIASPSILETTASWLARPQAGYILGPITALGIHCKMNSTLQTRLSLQSPSKRSGAVSLHRFQGEHLVNQLHVLP